MIVGPPAGYKPISSYGIIGDMSTAALVGDDGSIDWCCLPRFDSPSLFAALLDERRGGRFRIAPAAPFTSTQRYLPATNILVTAFHTHDGSVVELTDFMPWGGRGTRFSGYHEVHRRIQCTRGETEVEIWFEPRFGYALGDVDFLPRRHGVIATDRMDEAVALSAEEDIWWEVDREAGTVRARLGLRAGERQWLVLRYDDDEVGPVRSYRSQTHLDRTAKFWDEWVAGLRYDGPYRSEVERSALLLKLLFYEPTGAVVAAPTTSLPEEIGGVRNWDYRFTWLRDAAFTLSALHGLGQYGEAERFTSFLKRVTRKGGERLQIMFGIGGERDLHEQRLDHLEGYRGSRPVRRGNAAFRQPQNDIYGELMEALFLWQQQHDMTEGTWTVVVRLAEWVSRNWRDADSGIWEVRAERRHYVFSKVMCWVALDRAIAMAESLDMPGDLPRWRQERAAAQRDVLERGWNEERGAFRQHYETEALDASNLLIGRVGFLPPDDPRVLSNIRVTMAELAGPEHELVYRYLNPDGLPGREGVFACCTYWLADALILAGEIDEGERIFQRMLQHANRLGLYSEQIKADTGELLGNYPQALTHIALINTARLLAEARSREGRPHPDLAPEAERRPTGTG